MQTKGQKCTDATSTEFIQLFRARLSDKVHATTPKGIVGGFEFTVFQRNLVVKESNNSRFDSYSVRNTVLNISQVTFRDCRLHIFSTTFLKIAVYET